MHVEVIVEGDLPNEMLKHTLEEIRANTEAAIHQPCLVVGSSE